MANTNYHKGKTYKKDKKVSIMTVDEVQDDEGHWVEASVPVADNIWAYYRHASGNEFFSAAQVNYKVEAVFKIAWRNDINTGMTVLYKGVEYGITRIDDYEGYKRDLTIYAYTLEG